MEMGNEVQVAQDQRVSVSKFLSNVNVEKRFRDMLGNRTPAFISSIISAVSMNKMLQEATPESVTAAAAVAASLDLPINPSLGMAHIVPYKENSKGPDGWTSVVRAQFQLGWKGFIQLAIRSGQYRHINIVEIHEGDIRSINRFTGVIDFNEGQIANYASRPIVGYMLYFSLVTGYEKFFYMTKEECEAHGIKYSKSYDTGNWKKDFDGMARKTVVKMGLSKYGILSVDMQKAITTDQAIVGDDGEVVDYPDNGADEPLQLTEEVKVVQTLRQQYETLKLQLTASGKEKLVADLINGHSGMSKHAEKDFDDNDLKYCIGEMEREMVKK
jgi:recombination protein RecT